MVGATDKNKNGTISYAETERQVIEPSNTILGEVESERITSVLHILKRQH
jgi:hypothetical protein